VAVVVKTCSVVAVAVLDSALLSYEIGENLFGGGGCRS